MTETAAPTATSLRPSGSEDSPPGEDPEILTGATKHRAGRAALAELMRPVRLRLLLARLLAAISGILVAAPYLALVELGRVLLPVQGSGSAPDSEAVSRIVMLLVTAFSAQLTFLAVALATSHFADLRLGSILRDRIIERIAGAPLSAFTRATSGRLRKAVQDETRTLHYLVAHSPVEITVAIIAPLGMLLCCFTVDVRLGLLAVVMIPVYLLLQAVQMRGMGAKTAQMDEKLSDVSSTAVEFAEGISVVKAFGRTGSAHARYTRACDEFIRFYLAWVGPLLRAGALSETVVSIPVLLLVNLLGGAYLVHLGAVGPADLIATTLIALVLPRAITTLGQAAWSQQMAGNAALRLRQVLSMPVLDDPAASGTGTDESAGAPVGEVVFEEVSFGYEDGADVLHGVSAHLAPGTVTALVGPSGSGKSTLAMLLARFDDPRSGRILVGGRDIRELSTRELYRRVGFVLQEARMLRLSVRENIRLARPEATDEQIWEAARAARIDADIAALPRGLDTVLGEETSFSGGQAQRAAIARALLADAPILILDEATSAMDPDCEVLVQQALNRLLEGRTVLVIAHRPEVVQGVDQVLAMNDGALTATLTGREVTTEAIAELMGSPGSGAPTTASDSTASDDVEQGDRHV